MSRWKREGDLKPESPAFTVWGPSNRKMLEPGPVCQCVVRQKCVIAIELLAGSGIKEPMLRQKNMGST